MSFGDSKAIVSNQEGIHDKLEEIVKKHLSHTFEKPYSQHTLAVFNALDKEVKQFDGEVILDACCGVGQSTRILAKRNPQALVIGVDKSAHRIERNVDEHIDTSLANLPNVRLVRADLNDFYRLVAQANWPIKQHYILYPNPWPKAKHIQRRWHGSAVLPQILAIGERIELRSNWPLYLQEFAKAAEFVGGFETEFKQVIDDEPITPFEAKYRASGQTCFQLVLSRQ
ncbi:methyltransferase domain-containing protein [Thalassotalea sp. LPB0316]|uniref:tRNA (guanine(46)-N(7))-methyltransferase TrmB n=1 Tax=Thalassotalea sp. LPB0316 TaxID=2769490 RepID=UPI001865C6E6|nr:methyltransferase domain-containing protein [Thalassotalea sp. LPB0316]QOL26697.1 methyltransferase domain-containing protein [Thalassotalea sp. LPB0316]